MPWNKQIGAQAPGYHAEVKGEGGVATESTEYKSMTNDELREELTRRGLPTSGNKDELVERLEEHDSEA